MIKFKLLFCVLFFLLNIHSVLAKPLNVVFVVPDQKGPLFWQYVSEIAKSVADDMDINLELIYTDSDRFASKEAIFKITERIDKPDYIIFRPFAGNAITIFNQLEKHRLPFVTLEQALFGKEGDAVGQPREKYKYWLGQVNYDNVKGGHLLLSALVKHHRKRVTTETAYITGIGGGHDVLSKNRTKALTELDKHGEGVFLNQLFSFNWDPKRVKQKYNEMMRRYPNTDIFWCAGDQMALALVEKIQSLPAKSAKTISVGGFDWLPEALEKINSGEMSASVGGHMLMAGVAVILIKDYHSGIDRFSLEKTSNLFELIDSDNVQQYLPFLRRTPWPEVDYSIFLHHNKKHADQLVFNMANIMKVQDRKNIKITPTSTP